MGDGVEGGMFAFPFRRQPAQRASDQPLPQPSRPVRDRQLERAITWDEVEVRFQPQFCVATGAVAGVEALARWNGSVGPSELFERAAQAQLSERLSRAVQRKALRTVGRWQGEMATLRLSLNLLPQDLARPGYEGWLLQEIADAGLRPERVTAEITEGSLVTDPIAASARLARLRAAGVRIAVDDFGTGYASLAYLISLPLDTLKIDRGLIADVVGGARDRIVVKALVALARELKLQLVVEGVEDPAQLELLQQWGCDLYQGFLGAEALDEAGLAALLSRLRTAPVAAPGSARA
jgi:EAL domain-containing protein (putative c-di-GMP-specific phosphodiesterase class I)